MVKFCHGAPVYFTTPDNWDTTHGYNYPHAVSEAVDQAHLYIHSPPPPGSLRAEDVSEWLGLVSHASFIYVVGSAAVWPASSMSFPRLAHLRTLSIRTLHQAIIFRILENTLCLEAADINCRDSANMKIKSSVRLSLPRLRILAISGHRGSGENLFIVLISSSIQTLQSLSMDVKYPRVAVALDQPNHIEHLRLRSPFVYSTRKYNVFKEAFRIIRPCGRVRHLELDGYSSAEASMILSSISQPLQSLAMARGEPLKPGILSRAPCTRTLRVFAIPIGHYPLLPEAYSRIGRRVKIIRYKYSWDPRDGFSSHNAWFGSRFHRGSNEPWTTGRRDPQTKDSGDTWCNSRLFSILCSCRTTDS
ncbi:hypothetical protein BKA62DRAFT_676003 [Auriculariales sp. MPI-PUGE-AT-0066]|nr:hypothetical protein BKA62DRAFT_676003 [Auriculariales sp. MPI-PUGE-AT-0066]